MIFLFGENRLNHSGLPKKESESFGQINAAGNMALAGLVSHCILLFEVKEIWPVCFCICAMQCFYAVLQKTFCVRIELVVSRRAVWFS